MKIFRHKRPSSLEEAVALLQSNEEDVRVIAGGTDLLGTLKDRIHQETPGLLVDLKKIPDLAGIRRENGGVHIGALTRLSTLASDPATKDLYPLLAEAARAVASPQIRNMGTLAGNICQEPRCWYYRQPENYFFCLRKGGGYCPALMGDNRYHSIFGAERVAAPACTSGCPAQTPIPEYLNSIRQGDLPEAARLILDVNPMPAITGRVCPHFCQQACNRQQYDRSLSIRAIERHVGDWILEDPAARMPQPAPDTNRRVAVIGAGPAGLSAAFHLRRQGHQVVIYELQEEAGGMLTYAIPAYRLPKEVVRRQVRALQDMGISFQTGVRVDGDRLAALAGDHDAVFLACGAWRETSLKIPGDDLITSGLSILQKINQGDVGFPHQKVAVIGGGNVALDVARSLKRLGKHPLVIYRRSEHEMPAIAEEVSKARQEGIGFQFLTLPVAVARHGEKLKMTCIRMKLGKPDSSGRPKPEPVEGSEFSENFDAVAKAIGETADTEFLPTAYLNGKGWVEADASGHVAKNIFAGGDFVTGPSTVIQSVADGRRIADAIHAVLTGRHLAVSMEKAAAGHRDGCAAECIQRFEAVPRQETAAADRAEQTEAEDVEALTSEQIEAEASRCLDCACVAVSPSDLAPALTALEAEILTTRRAIPAGDFFCAGVKTSTVLAPGEIITAVKLPYLPATTRQVFLKIRPRQAIDFPVLNAAVAIDLSGRRVAKARIVIGAAGPSPVRAREAEFFLEGKELTRSTIEQAASLAVAGAEPLSKNAYKIRVTRALIEKALTAIA